MNSFMTTEQARRVSHLIRKLCANYRDGLCLPLCYNDDVKCPQIGMRSSLCKYFKESILGNDPVLEAELLGHDHEAVKDCPQCGSRFVPKSNRSEYCPKCAEMIRKERARKRKQKQRGNVTL